MSFLRSMDIAASGLTAQRVRMDVIAQNVANISTTRGPDGAPYQRKYVIMQERDDAGTFKERLSKAVAASSGDGVNVTEIAADTSPFKLIYDPNHPDANAEGYVEMPNVEYVTEMVDMMSATRSYEANVTALNAFKYIATKALQIGQ